MLASRTQDYRAYETTRDSQEYLCPCCAKTFEFFKMINRTKCPNCGVNLVLKGFRG